MAKLQDAVDYLADMVGQFGEVVVSPEYPRDNYPDSPFGATMPNYGRCEFVTMGPKILSREDHWVLLEVHVQRRDLPTDMKKIRAICDELRNALRADISLGGCGYQVQEFWYTYGPSGWNERNIFSELNTLAWKFSIRVRRYEVPA